ncbi:MAG: galactokinase [Ignavibacteriae bacterium]|nr:galactokinase [Ignavibacteriota bacterium]
MIQKIRAIFHERLGGEPFMVRSPGRVNLIGEHTDYNEGFVLPATIDKSIILAVAPRNDDLCRMYSADFDQSFETTLDSLGRSELKWPDYLLGVVDQLLKYGAALRGFDVAFGGNIPIASGLSSSAAIEAGLAFALNTIFHLQIDTLTLVKLAHMAENEFVGVRCGIMDQFVNLFGKEHRLLRLDCRSLEFEYVPFERSDIRIVLCDTQVKRELASTEYNIRRQQCETGVTVLQKHYGSIHSLRDVSLDTLQRHREEFDPTVYRRCEYVICENARVLEACNDLRRADLSEFGRKMFESHTGLRDNYEVSCSELDLFVEIASHVPGVLGARMMGAGFGGCTINLVEESRIQEFGRIVTETYRKQFGKDVAFYIMNIKSGTAAERQEKVRSYQM